MPTGGVKVNTYGRGHMHSPGHIFSARRGVCCYHPRASGTVTLTVATWRVVLGATRWWHGYPRGALLFPVAALEGFAGYRLLATTQQ